MVLGIERQRRRSLSIVPPLARRPPPKSAGPAIRPRACHSGIRFWPPTFSTRFRESEAWPISPKDLALLRDSEHANVGCRLVQVDVPSHTCRRWARFGASAMILPMLLACSSEPPKPIAFPSTVTTTTTTPQAQLDALILSQWRAAMIASVAASKDPTAEGLDLQLANYFVDPLLSYLRNQYAARARDGLADTGDLDLGQPHVTSINDRTAVVLSCMTDRLILVDTATGKPLPGTNPNAALEEIRSELALSPSNQWKISMNTLKVGSCGGL
ncbi:MAG: hypothetical protein QOK39_759 [Acidimicrobiaceae bacterium]|nr:hypothetical protein [Acidimicrobiaceae bacterium]